MGDIKYRIRIDRVDDEMQLYEFEYQMRRKVMTEDEHIREDVEMEQHIKIATTEIINNMIKTIRERCLVMPVTKRDRWESTSQRTSNV
jgi:hypothetical protein